MLEEQREKITAAINAVQATRSNGVGCIAGTVRHRHVQIRIDGESAIDIGAIEQAARMLCRERLTDRGDPLPAAAFIGPQGAQEQIVVVDDRGMAFRLSYIKQYMRGQIDVASAWVAGNASI